MQLKENGRMNWLAQIRQMKNRDIRTIEQSELQELQQRTRKFIRDKIIPLENDSRQTHHGPTEEFRKELVALAAAERSGALAARYELRAAGALVALIQTGTDQHGNPDYGATRALIQRIAAT